MASVDLTFAGVPSWKGALHCHSNLSDGRLDPAEVTAAYRSAGYDFVALTDHFEAEYGWRVTDTSSLRTTDFVTLAAAELSTGPWSDPATVWINALGIPDVAALKAEDDPIARIAELHRSGAYTMLVHPGLNQQRDTGLAVLDHVDAVEIYTHAMATTWPDQANGAYYVDDLLAHGRRVAITAGDDAHFTHARDRFGAWVTVACDELEAPALLDALHRGAYYSTTGPIIRSVLLEGTDLHIEVDAASAIVVNGLRERWLAAQQQIATASLLHEARFDVSGFVGSCCRITVVDSDGRRAWCNPLWID